MQDRVMQAVDEAIVNGVKSVAQSSAQHQQLITSPLQVQPKTLHALSKLYGPNARFKSIEQGQLVEAACRRDQHVLAVLPTGAGKSLAFMVPPILERSQHMFTVVLAPMNSLLQDLKRRLESSGIESAIWMSGETPPRVHVLLANYAAVENPGFMQYLTQEAQEGRLSRIGVDECHYPLLNMDFRPGMARLSSLFTHGVPLVLLTGTLPPTEMANLLRIFAITPDSIREIRQETVVPNMVYVANKVEATPSQDADTIALRRLKREMKTNMNLGGLAIIFCRSKDELNFLYDYLQEADEAMEAELARSDHVADTIEGSGLKIFKCYATLSPGEKKKALEDWRA